jgi:hypothetical protein
MNNLARNDLPPNGAVPRLFDEAIDRSNTDLSDEYMPSAPVALVASEEVVRRATEDCPAISRRRRWRSCNHPSDRGWEEIEWINIERNCILQVWRRGKLWHVGRRFVSRPFRAQSLGFVFGPVPICTHTAAA